MPLDVALALALVLTFLSLSHALLQWCIDDLNITVPSYVNRTYVLSFNEPNNLHK